MENIKAWCITISAVSVLGGLLYFLIPKSGTKKAFSVLVYMTMLYTLLSPLIKGERLIPDFDDYIQSNDRLKEEYGEKAYEPAKEVAEAEIERSIIALHSERDIEISCRVECRISAESFSVEEIVIEGKLSDSQKEKSRRLLEEYMTKNTVIYFTETDYE